MKVLAWFVTMAVLFSLITLVDAQFDCTASLMCRTVCRVINSVRFTLETIAPTMVILMFIYGGVKYTFSADDPGGRKAGKMTCIHALIGGIIIALSSFAASILVGWTACDPSLFL